MTAGHSAEQSAGEAAVAAVAGKAASEAAGQSAVAGKAAGQSADPANSEMSRLEMNGSVLSVQRQD